MAKGQRRNPLEPPDEELTNTWRQFLAPIADPERLEGSERRKTKGRKREWENSHRGKFYRGVSVELREAIKTVAHDLSVSADEVARAFAEYSLMCLQQGRLTLTGMPSQRRLKMTLYPFSGAGWAENGWTPKPPRSKGHKQKDKGLWRQGVCYRIPDEVHEQIKTVSGDVYPVGEVMAVLLKNGLEAYRQGVLVLLPQPKMPFNLNWKGREE